MNPLGQPLPRFTLKSTLTLVSSLQSTLKSPVYSLESLFSYALSIKYLVSKRVSSAQSGSLGVQSPVYSLVGRSPAQYVLSP
jgi:hypothetical protein